MTVMRIFISIALLISALLCRAQSSEPVYSEEPETAGTLMLIPDSLAAQVRSVLEGKSVIRKDNSVVDLNEMTIVRGDTVPMIIKQRNFGRFSRGLYNYLFIPKGSWMVGLTASYGEFSTDDLQMLDILSDLDFSGHSFAINPSISYFIGNNLSVGLKFTYNNTSATLASMAVDFDEDLNFNITDASYTKESYTSALVLRQFIGLGRRSRFGVFNEVELAFSSGNSDFIRKYADTPKVTHTTYMDTRLNFSPGVTVFMMKNVSFNISFGVFGFYLRNEKQTTDGEWSGSRFTSGANFRFNIFNINFGLGIVL